MIIVQGWVRLASEDIAMLRAAAEDMMRMTRQAEPGCLEYAFAVDMAEPGVLRVIERWADEPALAAHFASAHMASFNEALSQTKILGASVKAYSASEVRTIMEM